MNKHLNVRKAGLAAVLAMASLSANAEKTVNVAPHAIPPLTPQQATSATPLPPIVTQWVEAWNHCDPKAMSALYAADAIYDDFAFQGRSEGKEGIANWAQITCKNISKLHVTVLDAAQHDDTVVLRWVFDGTPPQGTPMATGKSFSVPALSILKLKNGLIQYSGDYYNLADLFRQLGIPAGPWTPPA